VLIGLTIARLRMRFDDRLRKKASFSPPSELQNLKKDGSYVAPFDLNGAGFGLGNFIFILASLHGIAKTNNRTVVLLEAHPHESIFVDLNVQRHTVEEVFDVDSLQDAKDQTWAEVGWGKYDASVTNISANFGKRNVAFRGYLQAYRNFDLYRDEIRRLFVMKKTVTEVAIGVLKMGLESFSQTKFAGNLRSLPRLVGVHVRRGDIVKGVNHDYGHQPASDEYLLRTVLHLQTEHEPVVFVVLSNDIAYCKELFREENFIFMDHHDKAQVDMAILTLMDYLILSVGTFGWWGAYLSDAREVHYYRDWPRNGSEMQKGITPQDYFPHYWIAGT
jgi:galactoside 2-L-fucosyltransferase 1/2